MEDDAALSPRVVVAAILVPGLLLLHQARLLTVPLVLVFVPATLTVGYAGVVLGADVVLALAVTAVGTRVAGGLRGRRAGVAAFVALLAVSAWCVNFSALSPRGYFALHRWEFDLAASAGPGRLPPHLAHLALDGEASDAAPGAVLLTSWAGLHDNAGGYVHADARVSPGTYVELSGRTMPLGECARLGGGWWWC
ncbi:MAG TPA: hypothetical protein VGX28_16650 [Frankiaceae bacterium]|nr:hypothetical protein [Frankiaceae bacterium]